jgi:PTH2 family peptidyl-tRNA hydrolase
MTDDARGDGRIRIFVNTNLTWSRGKMAAHVAHAALTAAGVHPGVPIVVLGAKPRDIEKMSTVMRDEGRTELEPGTLTAGTDYTFESTTARATAVEDLQDIMGYCDDEDIVRRLSAVVDLLEAR